jgi:hypothetical protein
VVGTGVGVASGTGDTVTPGAGDIVASGVGEAGVVVVVGAQAPKTVENPANIKNAIKKRDILNSPNTTNDQSITDQL